MKSILYPTLALTFTCALSACATQSDTFQSAASLNQESLQPSAASAASDPPSDAAPQKPYVVEFRGRSIDLEPYVQGFPFSYFQPNIEQQHILYFETTERGKQLYIQPLKPGKELDLYAGHPVGNIDWSTRNYWGGDFHKPSARYLIAADEKNDERINLYWLDTATGALEQTTDHDYIYAYEFSADHTQLAYVARHGTAEPFNACLYVRDLSKDVSSPETDQQILCDNGGKDRFTWSSIQFAPDAKSLILRIQHDGDRNTTNLAQISLTDPKPSFQNLLKRGTRHFQLSLIRDTLTEEGFVYVSAHTGFANLYRYDFKTRKSHTLTDYKDEIDSVTLMKNAPQPETMHGTSFDGTPRAARLQTAGQPVLTVILQRPYESEILVLDPETGSELYREQSDDSVSLYDDHNHAGVLRASSVATPFRMDYFELTTDSLDASTIRLTRKPLASVPRELARRTIHCNTERVSFPTFDKLPDGTTRMLHGYMMSPRNQPEPEQRIVRITAFYGGGNYFSNNAQIMCEAGVATFSPAPRGSSGFGAEFAALNDGDLGGDEIIDIFYAARFLESQYGYKPHQIGVFGGSHGGYATMRALTFPPHTNNRNESYAFGFGISSAGFSDILTFFETSNIPDWVILEAGDPKTEADKLRDRSPINHVERLQAPLLLIHGENDSRVPVSESRRFAERARELDRPVTYVEFPGQGHSINGLDNTLTYYRTIFDFLTESVVPQLH